MKGSTIMTANAKNSAAKNLIDSAVEEGLVTEDNKTVPAQNGSKDKVTVGEGTGPDGQTKTVIHLGEEKISVEEKIEEALTQSGLQDQIAEFEIVRFKVVDGEIKVDITEAGKIKKLVAGVKGKVAKNKKAIIAGGVAVLVVALGVTVQKKRIGTDEESETVEPTDEV